VVVHRRYRRFPRADAIRACGSLVPDGSSHIVYQSSIALGRQAVEPVPTVGMRHRIETHHIRADDGLDSMRAYPAWRVTIRPIDQPVDANPPHRLIRAADRHGRISALGNDAAGRRPERKV